MANSRIVSAAFADNIADINNGHSLVFPQVDPIIKDILSREHMLRDRMKSQPEELETFRWVEQTGIARNAAFADPRNIAPTATDAPTRVEKLAKLKCITSRIKYSFFDKKLTSNGSFGYVIEKDMRDAIEDCLAVSNTAIYNGTDTSYGTPTTNQYMGLFTAITQTAELKDTTKTLYQQIKTLVAKMASKKFGEARSLPTAIYMNPMTADIIDTEVDNKDNDFKLYPVQLKPGIMVTGIMTAAGVLPIIRDPEIPLTANKTDATKYDHKILILNEDQIVRHYFTSEGQSFGDPVVFKLGLTESLADDYVIFMADNVVCRYGGIAHCVATFTA